MSAEASRLREADGLDGDLFKLVSQNGTLLGTETVRNTMKILRERRAAGG